MKPVAIVGMPGAGKSTVGRRLADYLGWDFVDVDEKIEHVSGYSIPDIFRKFGEKRFREIEKEELGKLSGMKGVVVATGGGTVLDPENRKILLEDMDTFYIDVPIEEIESRSKDLKDRPLLAGNFRQRLHELYERRAGHYSMFKMIAAKNLSSEAVAALIAREIVDIGERSTGGLHPVVIKKLTRSDIKPFRVVSTGQVWEIYDFFDPAALYLMPDGEDAKELTEVERLYRKFIDWKLDRGEQIVAMGGGALTDSVGFAVATFKRGCGLINIPTTLLGQIDAAIGGKNGINLGGVKNVIGTFKLPEIVIADPLFALSMEYGRYVEGLVEGVKVGLVASRELIEFIEKHIDELIKRNISALWEFVFRAVSVKMSVVGNDLYDRGRRMILNFGHTVGHAIENTYGLTHGEAVAIGMLVANHVGIKMGISTTDIGDFLLNIFRRLGVLPNVEIDVDAIWNKLLQDKKILRKNLRFVVLRDIGSAEVVPVDEISLKSLVEGFFYEGSCD